MYMYHLLNEYSPNRYGMVACILIAQKNVCSVNEKLLIDRDSLTLKPLGFRAFAKCCLPVKFADSEA